MRIVTLQFSVFSRQQVRSLREWGGFQFEFDSERVEDVRAAILPDIGKLDISGEILYKAGRLTKRNTKGYRRRWTRGLRLGLVGGSLRRVIPIVLAHHDRIDGSGYHHVRGEKIPVEARIISVVHVYGSLTSNRPYRKGMSPFDARDILVKGSGA